VLFSHTLCPLKVTDFLLWLLTSLYLLLVHSEQQFLPPILTLKKSPLNSDYTGPAHYYYFAQSLSWFLSSTSTTFSHACFVPVLWRWDNRLPQNFGNYLPTTQHHIKKTVPTKIF
jgi:hypothetical protein